MTGNPTPSKRDYLFAWCENLTTERLATVADGHCIGHGPHETVWRRPITDDPWPFTPDNCGFAEYTQGHWTRSGNLLFCLGCGLDGT